MRNIPSNFEVKRIAESFFRDKGTFSIDNVLGLMSKAFEAGYEKGHLDGKHQSPVPSIKTVSASDFKAATNLNYWDQFQGNSMQPIIPPLNATTLEEALKKCQL